MRWLLSGNFFRFFWHTFTRMPFILQKADEEPNNIKPFSLEDTSTKCYALTRMESSIFKSLMFSHVTLGSTSISSRTRWGFFSFVISMGHPDLVSFSNESRLRLNSQNHFVTVENETPLSHNNVLISSKHRCCDKLRFQL